jgi:hypothetical protein
LEKITGIDMLRAEKREKKKTKRRHAPRGGTLGGVNVKIQVSRGFLKKKRRIV